MQITGADRHGGVGRVRDVVLAALNGGKAALPVAVIDKIGQFEVIADQKVRRAVQVDIAEQHRQGFAGHAGQVGEIAAIQCAAFIEQDAVAGFFARDAAIPACGPIAQGGIKIAIGVDIGKAKRKRQHRVLAIGDCGGVGDVQHSVAV